MLGHVGVQDVLQDLFTAVALLFIGHALEHVAVLAVVFDHEEEGGRVVVLQDGHVVVEDGQLRFPFDFEEVVRARVVNIVGCPRNKRGEDVDLAHLTERVDILLEEHEVEVLDDVGGVALVVVGVLAVGLLQVISEVLVLFLVESRDDVLPIEFVFDVGHHEEEGVSIHGLVNGHSVVGVLLEELAEVQVPRQVGGVCQQLLVVTLRALFPQNLHSLQFQILAGREGAGLSLRQSDRLREAASVLLLRLLVERALLGQVHALARRNAVRDLEEVVLDDEGAPSKVVGGRGQRYHRSELKTDLVDDVEDLLLVGGELFLVDSWEDDILLDAAETQLVVVSHESPGEG